MSAFGEHKSVWPHHVLRATFCALAFVLFAASPAKALSLEEICTDSLSHPEKTPTKFSYCKSAQDAQVTADAESKLWKVWAGVATVCAGACASSITGVGTQTWVCQGANGLAGVIEGGVKKDLAAAMGGLGAAAGGVVLNKALDSGKKDPEKSPEKSKDWAACAGAAFAAGQSFSKHKTMNDSEASVAANLDSASKLKDTQNLGFEKSANGLNLGQGAGTGSIAGGILAVTGSSPQALGAPLVSSGSLKSQGVIAGALAADRKLPPWVSDPKFAQEFQKVAKTELSDFMEKAKDPSSALTSALGGSFSSASVSTVASALKELDAAPGEDASGRYAGSGGGAGSGEKATVATDSSLSEMLSGFFGPKAGQMGKKQSGASEIVFADKTRSPASIFEDRKLSLFDRVRFRYSRVSDRLEGK